jgi:hypothetical protein
MIDTMLAPGTMDAVITVGPAALGVLAALIAGVAWLARSASEELRRSAAREWERRTATPGPNDGGRLAA